MSDLGNDVISACAREADDAGREGSEKWCQTFANAIERELRKKWFKCALAYVHLTFAEDGAVSEEICNHAPPNAHPGISHWEMFEAGVVKEIWLGLYLPPRAHYIYGHAEGNANGN
ncbi:hypothetical protein [Paraburkholderia sp. SIMBA_027]|uniref:hypothetical protein n=1 Tax=Paraburkholderia sp. SIMBA_027 TaxID=3085770 RepID=UPI00397CF35B